MLSDVMDLGPEQLLFIKPTIGINNMVHVGILQLTYKLLSVA